MCRLILEEKIWIFYTIPKKLYLHVGTTCSNPIYTEIKTKYFFTIYTTKRNAVKTCRGTHIK